MRVDLHALVLSERLLCLIYVNGRALRNVLNMMGMTGKWDIYAGYVRSRTNIFSATNSLRDKL